MVNMPFKISTFFFIFIALYSYSRRLNFGGQCISIYMKWAWAYSCQRVYMFWISLALNEWMDLSHWEIQLRHTFLWCLNCWHSYAKECIVGVRCNRLKNVWFCIWGAPYQFGQKFSTPPLYVLFFFVYFSKLTYFI